MYKYGYCINEEKYHEPDEQYFEVRKEAFRRKIYENQTDEMIWKFIISSGFKRKYKNANREGELNKKGLYKIWLDPFYYGILISGNDETDLRDGANPYYKPLISEEEHMILLDRHLKANPVSLRAYKTTEEYDEIKPFPNKFIMYEGQGLTFELPNPKRFRTALAKLKVTNPDASLKDIVKPNQIQYKLAGTKINEKQLSIDAEILINSVSEYFKDCFQVNEKSYEIYRKYQLKDYDVNMKKINEKRRTLQNQFNHTSSLMENYARNFIKQNNTDAIQKKVYHGDIQKYQEQLDYLEQELAKVSINHRNTVLELDAFVQGISKLGENYDKASYVRKRKIVSLLFSNIIITSEKQIEFKAKPGFENLFTLNGGEVREDFERLNTLISTVDFTILRPIIQFSYFENKGFFDEHYKLSAQQEILYGLDRIKEFLS